MTTTLTWYGHATLGLETAGYHILVDPFFTMEIQLPAPRLPAFRRITSSLRTDTGIILAIPWILPVGREQRSSVILKYATGWEPKM